MATVRTADKVKRQEVFLITHTTFSDAMEFTLDYQRLFGLMMHIQISYSADCFSTDNTTAI